MSLRNRLIGTSLAAALLSVFAVTGAAQQPQGPPNQRGQRTERIGRPGREGREGREGMRGPEMGLLRQLDLTDAERTVTDRGKAKPRSDARPTRRVATIG